MDAYQRWLKGPFMSVSLTGRILLLGFSESECFFAESGSLPTSKDDLCMCGSTEFSHIQQLPCSPEGGKSRRSLPNFFLHL